MLWHACSYWDRAVVGPHKHWLIKRISLAAPAVCVLAGLDLTLNIIHIVCLSQGQCVNPSTYADAGLKGLLLWRASVS